MMRRYLRTDGQLVDQSSPPFSGQAGSKAFAFISPAIGLPWRDTTSGAASTHRAFGSQIEALFATWNKFMNSSIKAIIRALLVREHRIVCNAILWKQIIRELERRGERRHEAGAFLLGVERKGRRYVTDVLFYDELDRRAYSTGVCVLYGDSFGKLWARCREKQLMVVADVHTHPGEAFQSVADKNNPMVATSGHHAIIVPNFGAWPISPAELGVYEYCGNHSWIDRSPSKSKRYFYTGFWS